VWLIAVYWNLQALTGALVPHGHDGWFMREGIAIWVACACACWKQHVYATLPPGLVARRRAWSGCCGPAAIRSSTI